MKYVFLHRIDGRYYWRRVSPIAGMPGLEEIVWCDVDWFWGHR